MSQSQAALEPLRQRIDEVDHQLLELLAQRQGIVEEVAIIKKTHGLEVNQPSRFDALLAQLILTGKALDLSEELIQTIWMAIHEESKRRQQQVLDKSQL